MFFGKLRISSGFSWKFFGRFHCLVLLSNWKHFFTQYVNNLESNIIQHRHIIHEVKCELILSTFAPNMVVTTKKINFTGNIFRTTKLAVTVFSAEAT